MNETMRESLSAVLDGEANEVELERTLRLIGADAELRQTFIRYSAASAAVQGHAIDFPHLDVSQRVLRALEGERQQAPRLHQRLLRPLGGVAIAASVALTAVLGGQQLAQLGAVEAGSVSQTVAADPSPVGMVNALGATAVHARYGTQPVPVLQPAARTAYQELARQRMDRYMQEHAEHAALNTPQGLVLFARVPEIRR